jgi:putative nucleotidyltransferase with HDIG domain
MKRRLLFVDDDINVLEGLRRVLRNQQDGWEMHFARSGAGALDLMDTTAIDIIIADISMPDMDGIQLLEQVMARHPTILRMIFSGRPDSDLVIRAIAVTHQYLSMPCSPELLVSIIRQAAESRAFLPNEYLQHLASKLGVLPGVPALYRQLVRELQSREASIARVGEIISQDPSMAAKILQLANSAFFGRRHSISSIGVAVSYLGLDRVAKLILAIHAFEAFIPPVSALISVEKLWAHSNRTAIRARNIAEEQHASKSVTDDAFTAGLLHDIGKLVLACRFPEDYAAATKKATERQHPLWVVERDVLFATHAEVGAYLLSIWGLPDKIIEAIAFHHTPTAMGTEGFSALTAVHAADMLENLAESSVQKAS